VAYTWTNVESVTMFVSVVDELLRLIRRVARHGCSQTDVAAVIVFVTVVNKLLGAVQHRNEMLELVS